MSNRVESTLLPELFDVLQKEHYVLIATIDHEYGGPNVNAISWVYAKNDKTVLFALDQRSRILSNIKADNQVIITLITNGSTYSISGKAKVVMDKLHEVPLKLTLIKLDIEHVRDVMFYGSKITTQPEYDKTYDKKAAERLDLQVIEAMKKA
jgi:hypothetical protein